MLPRITSCSTNSPLVSRKVLLFVDNAFMTSPAVWARHSEFRAQLREKRLKGHFQPVPISLPVDMRRACAQEFGEGGDLRDRLAGVDGRGQGVDRDAGGGAALAEDHDPSGRRRGIQIEEQLEIEHRQKI